MSEFALRVQEPAKEPRRRRGGYIEIDDRVAGKQALREANEDLSSTLFLGLPFDLLFEISRELDLDDLLQLSRTSRAFRRLFLHKSSRQIWAAMRQRDGYLKPDSMKEDAFAIVLVGDKCQVAGCVSTKKVSTLWAFRARLCKSCIDTLLVSRAGAKKIEGLHKKTLSCTPYALFAGKSNFFVKSILETTSLKLFELETDVANSRASSSTKADRNAKAKQGSSKALDDYVEKAQQHVEEVKQDVRTSEQGLKNAENLRLERQELAAEQARLNKISAAESFDEELKRDHGWTDEMLEYVSGKSSGGGFMRGLKGRWMSQKRPLVAPSVGPKAWLAFRLMVEEEIEEHKYEDRVGPERDLRLERLRLYYVDLKQDLDDELGGVTPTFYELKGLEEIKELYFGEEAQLDDSTWPTQKLIVINTVRELAESMRIHAIRVILAANSGSTTTPKVLSNAAHKKKYSSDKYGNDFFAQITSLFHCYSKDEHEHVVVPWPEAVKYKGEWSSIASFLESSHTYKSACALRSVLAAASLDEETTEPSALDSLGKAFSWTEKPKATCSNKSWLDMVHHLEHCGPSIADLKAGGAAKVDFTPLGDSSTTMQVETSDGSEDV